MLTIRKYVTHQERGDLFDPTLPMLIKLETMNRYIFASQLSRQKHVLDLGCGLGHGSYLLSKVAASVTGVDNDCTSIQLANERYHSKNLTFICDDVIRFLGHAESQFHVVTCFEVIEHIPFQFELLKSIKRVLKPDGYLLLSTPNRRYTAFYRKNPYHVRELLVPELVELLRRAGYSIRQLYGQFPGWLVLLPFPYFFLAKLLQTLPNWPDVVEIGGDIHASRTAIALCSPLKDDQNHVL